MVLVVYEVDVVEFDAGSKNDDVAGAEYDGAIDTGAE